MSKRRVDDDAPRGSRDIETGDSESPMFGAKPVQCRCEFCKADITTQVKRKAGWLSRLTFVACILLGLGIFGCAFGGVVYNYMKNTIHKCPQCLNTLYVLPPFQFLGGMKGPSDDLLSFRAGAMAVIVTKRYVYVLLITVVGLLLVYRVHLRLEESQRVYFVGPPSTLTLDDYKADCGQLALSENPLHCITEFPKKYQDQSFRWSGRIKSINEGYDLYFLKVDHFLDLTAKSENFIVFLPPDKLPLVGNLKPGMDVHFNATLASYGVAHGMYLHDVEVVT
jgi:hypothetical protein